MSANINFDQNKASPIFTGSSGLGIAVMAGIKLLRIARLGYPLGIAGFILPLVLISVVILSVRKRIYLNIWAMLQNKIKHSDTIFSE